jgi:hypothetical protein
LLLPSLAVSDENASGLNIFFIQPQVLIGVSLIRCCPGISCGDAQRGDENDRTIKTDEAAVLDKTVDGKWREGESVGQAAGCDADQACGQGGAHPGIQPETQPFCFGGSNRNRCSQQDQTAYGNKRACKLPDSMSF